MLFYPVKIQTQVILEPEISSKMSSLFDGTNNQFLVDISRNPDKAILHLRLTERKLIPLDGLEKACLKDFHYLEIT